MNYGWTLTEFNAWYVFDELYCSWEEDSLCPPDYDQMLIGIEPNPDPALRLVDYNLDDSGGDGDGVLDYGETAFISIS